MYTTKFTTVLHTIRAVAKLSTRKGKEGDIENFSNLRKICEILENFK